MLFILLAGYPFSYSLDLYMILSTAGGAPSRNGFWLQSFGDGISIADSGGVLIITSLAEA
jgi:hypothetical protein